MLIQYYLHFGIPLGIEREEKEMDDWGQAKDFRNEIRKQTKSSIWCYM